MKICPCDMTLSLGSHKLAHQVVKKVNQSVPERDMKLHKWMEDDQGGPGEKAGGVGVLSASSVWYVAGRCWSLRRCCVYLTQVSPSHLETHCLDLRGRAEAELQGAQV